MAELFAPDGWIWQQLLQSSDRYIFDAVKQGYTPDWRKRIPENIFIGLDTNTPDLLERRKDWNTKTPEPFALPTEIWRETIERLQRCEDILGKINNGEVTSINDFITYNLDIRQFASDLINAGNASQAFIYNFYNALRSVTILDPTCGSGAFLFAAMNILEPLYYDCIMQLEGIERKSPDTQKALDEIKSKYRSNIHYFIYKSIILRNLYGVDIMAEATEIAKLRLFLKMVAVVDVQPLADNLGLDPLPDIDFNIRCGNTLVGYANAESIVRDHSGDMFAKHDFEENVAGEMDKVARTFKLFKHLQFTQESEHHEEFIAVKRQLRDLLASLNNTLNHHLHDATALGIPYGEWLSTHQPFNWVAEFYDIIHGNGGFDVIIGNPPYVEYNKKDRTTRLAVSDIYKIVNYQTELCGNLYAYVIERCYQLCCHSAYSGYIIPSASICTPRMMPLCNLLQKGSLWSSIWDERPSKLFDGVDQQLTIHILNRISNVCQITRMTHWHTEMRHLIFKNLSYNQYVSSLKIAEVLPKTQNAIETIIMNKLLKSGDLLFKYTVGSFKVPIYYKNAGGRYWRLIKSFPTFYQSESSNSTSTEKTFLVSSPYKDIVVCCLVSSLFYWFWRVVSNCRHLTNRELDSFVIASGLQNDSEILTNLRKQYEEDLKQNKVRTVTQSKSTGEIIQDFYYMKQSKPIIDEIDKVLAKHYGFTDEELDFIINYDIKYRMGDELNNEE